jgi:hypothetical protein
MANNKTWYSARLLFVAESKGETESNPLCEESIVLVLALDENDAKTNAENAARKMEHDYLNDQGEKVEWKFAGMMGIQDLCEQTLENGTEVYSRMFWKSKPDSEEVRAFLERSHPAEFSHAGS